MAATSILKLVVDDKDYEPKLRKATQAIDQLRSELEKQGKTFADADEEVVGFVRQLADMATAGKSARTQVREVTQSLTDLTVAYRGLSDEEKASPFGRELADTIDKLTERGGALQDAMTDVSASIRHAASDTRTFDQLAGAATLATSGIQTLQGAAKLLGIEWGDNVEVLAKLQAAMAVTNGLTTIQNALQRQSALMQGVLAVQAKAAAAAQALLAKNTGAATVAQRLFNTVAKANPYMLLVAGIGAVVGAISLFCGGQSEATEETNKLKDAIDRLNSSMETNISLAEQMGASSEQIARMRVEAAEAEVQMAETEKNKRSIYLKVSGSAGQQYYNQAVDAEIEARKRLAEAEKALAQVRLTRTRLENTWDKGKTEKEINTRIRLLKQQRSEVELGTQAYADYTDKITQLEARLPKTTTRTTTRTTGRTTTGTTNTTAPEVNPAMKMFVETTAETALSMSAGGLKLNIGEWKRMADESQRIAAQTKAMREEQANMVEGISITNSAGLSDWISSLQQSLSQADFGSALYTNLEAQLADTTTLKNLLQQSMKAGLGTSLFDAMDMNGESIWEKVLSPEGVSDADWEGIVAAINEQLAAMDLPTIKLNVKTGEVTEQAKDVAKEWNDAATAIQAVGNAMQQIEDPAAKVMGTIAQAIATIALTFAKSLEKTFGPWDWIAAAATGTATMISTISAIKSATAGSYAQGGIIPGNNHNDGLIANVSSGELILNRAQQDSIAAQLEGGGMQGMVLSTEISGENLRIVLNNNARRTGRGEYVTTNFTRFR